MDLIRPNGMVEPLSRRRPQVAFDGYDRPQPGRPTAEQLQAAARQDRRRERRRKVDVLRGRLVDLTA